MGTGHGAEKADARVVLRRGGAGPPPPKAPACIPAPATAATTWTCPDSLHSLRRRTECECPAHSQVDQNRARPAPIIARQDSLIGRGIGIEQAVLRRDQARLARIGGDARPAVEQRIAVNIAAGGDNER